MQGGEVREITGSPHCSIVLATDNTPGLGICPADRSYLALYRKKGSCDPGCKESACEGPGSSREEELTLLSRVGGASLEEGQMLSWP